MSDSKPSIHLSNQSLTLSQQQRSKHTSFEYEVIQSKAIQTGIEATTDDTENVAKCRKVCRRKKKRRMSEGVKDCQTYPCQSVCLDDEVCRKHSFCVVDGLRQHGCKPLYPKGLPWASGKLLYYPGQRPKYLGIMRETPQEISRIQEAKKRKKRNAKRKRDAALASLRQPDEEKLSDIVGSSQEMMLLMRTLAMVTSQRKANLAKKTTSTQPPPIEEEEQEEEEAEEDEKEENAAPDEEVQLEGDELGEERETDLTIE
ncbi:uncharacterized protein LOC111050536 [Nilaparvata lugens]|uniref:uncharacterized protein LOC111050536 n=1 Tax=Nilaparvata lugens TaxID=108931 RepID=UPI00193D43F4|nr:uncharacterized protein LOC111050536 [Nilaparvata lugens]